MYTTHTTLHTTLVVLISLTGSLSLSGPGLTQASSQSSSSYTRPQLTQSNRHSPSTSLGGPVLPSQNPFGGPTQAVSEQEVLLQQQTQPLSSPPSVPKSGSETAPFSDNQYLYDTPEGLSLIRIKTD